MMSNLTHDGSAISFVGIMQRPTTLTLASKFTRLKEVYIYPAGIGNAVCECLFLVGHGLEYGILESNGKIRVNALLN